jgi:transketolase
MHSNNKLIVGSADLSGSNVVLNSEYRIITAEDFSGNFIHYGIREHSMAAIMNGLALSSFLPIGATFLVFSDYMRPAIRLAALMDLQVVFIMTHDSIGEDGPTHQPIEHLASLRAMPNIDVFRPCDFVEVKECYEIILKNNNNKPSILALSRQSVPQIRFDNGQNQAEKGGYIISHECNSNLIDATIFATGSEVGIAVDVQKILESKNLSVRICSVPCFDILLRQSREYLTKLKGNARKIVAIEAASSFGWSEIIGDNGLFFGLDSFGASAPSDELYKQFGLTAENISLVVYDMLSQSKSS